MKNYEEKTASQAREISTLSTCLDYIKEINRFHEYLFDASKLCLGLPIKKNASLKK